MKIFYIDFENVKDNGLNGITKLVSSDIVRIYYSEDAQKITFGVHRRIMESPAQFEYVRINKDLKGVKNALDVSLMKDMSQRIIEEKSGEFFIVSNDSDYDRYIAEKKKNKINICRISEVCKATSVSLESQNNNINKKKEESFNKKEQVFRSYFGRHLKDYKDSKEYIIEAYMSAETRQEYNNNLQQYFNNDDVKDILAITKELTKNMPGNKN